MLHWYTWLRLYSHIKLPNYKIIPSRGHRLEVCSADQIQHQASDITGEAKVFAGNSLNKLYLENSEYQIK